MTFLVRYDNNFFGTLLHFHPAAISIPELESEPATLIKDLDLHFKNFSIERPSPGSFLGGRSNKLIFTDGIYEKEDILLHVKTLGISNNGFYLDVAFPEEFYDHENISDVMNYGEHVLEVKDELFEEIEKYLLNRSESTKLTFEKNLLTYFNAKIHFEESLLDKFASPFSEIIKGIEEHSRQILKNVKNVISFDLGIISSTDDFGEDGKIDFSIVENKKIPFYAMPRRSRIYSENILDFKKNNFVIGLRDVPFMECWKIIENII